MCNRGNIKWKTISQRFHEEMTFQKKPILNTTIGKDM